MSRSSRNRAGSAPAKQPSASPHLTGSQLQKLFVGVALALATFVVYSPCLDHPFSNFDDQPYVTENTHVQAGLTAESAAWAFTTLDCGNWHPLTWLSLELDSQLYGGQKAGGFHLTNILLHIGSALVLFLTLCAMTGQVWPSAVVAGLFAWHPLNVEPVAWVAERKGVLSTLFWMLSLAAYLYYVRKPGPRRYVLIVLSFLLGLMAKPMLVTLPFVLLLLDYWPLRRWRPGTDAASATPSKHAGAAPAISPRHLLMEKLPLLALALSWCVVAYVTQHHVQALPSLGNYPLDIRVENGLHSYLAYLGKMLWPVHLSIYYPHPGSAVSAVHALKAGAALLIVTSAVLWLGRRWPYLAVGWLWYLGTLVPLIGLVQIGDHAMADRYTYVPLVGIFLLLTWGVTDLAAAWRWPRTGVMAASAAILIGCLTFTWAQAGYWRSNRDLWEHAIAVTEKNAMAHNNLGTYYFSQGELDLAKKEFRQAAAIEPEYAQYRHNLGNVLRDLGRPEEAVVEFQKAIELDPQTALLHFNLGRLYQGMGRHQEALAEFRAAIEIDPRHPAPHNSLAGLLRDLGRHQEAVAEYQKAIEFDPAYAFPHAGLGNVLTDLGRYEEAVAAYRRAVDLSHEGAAHYYLGTALQAVGRLDEALVQFDTALKLSYVPAVRQLQACQKLRALRPRLARLIAGDEKPADNADRLGFAELCSQPFVGRHALAARLYADALSAEPQLAADLREGRRASAAVAAVQAGCGRGQDAASLDDGDKARWRRQALNWLQAELTLWKEQLQRDGQRALPAAQGTLRGWQRHPGLSGVRETSELAKLPEAERQEWQTWWLDVEAVVSGRVN